MKIDLSPSWKKRLNEEFAKTYFSELSENIDMARTNHNVLPKESDVFNAFNRCPLDSIKVVILGQDPYPTPGHAHGLSFSVPDSVRPLAKSLNNIYKEIEADIGKPMPESGNLDHWADQGVFLLNTVLTVNAHYPNSHKKFGWQKFTNEVIRIISKECNGVVFLLWGAQAHKKSELIDETKHHILQSVHPSPLSAYKGFFGCKHFSKANELLVLQGIKPINW